MRFLAQMVLIAAAGGALGLGMNALSPAPARLGQPVYAAAESGTASCSAPHGAPGAEDKGFGTISREEASGMCSACTAGFVDARPASEFARGHIPNAFHLPPHGHGNEAQVISELRHFQTVVVYDSGAGCDLAETVAKHLRAEGLPDVRILAGAWPGWEAGGEPAESGACAACEGHP